MSNIAILIPCYNEANSIKQVIQSFKKELPTARIYVYDNNSSDNTAKIAKENGAIVKKQPLQGKGLTVRSMFRDINADYYVLIDGDGTYYASDVHKLLLPLLNNEADMVIGDRLNSSYFTENKRLFHNSGNKIVRLLVNKLYSTNYEDIMTGYRAFNKVFVKTCPILSKGFEVETELSIHAADKQWRIKQAPVKYTDRVNSVSKLNTIPDGLRVLKTIIMLFKDYKPIPFSLIIAIMCFILSLFIGIPVINEFYVTGLVDKLPSAILALGLMILGFLFIMSGLILDSITKGNKRQWELDIINFLLTDKNK